VRDTELTAKWFEDIGAGRGRGIAGLDDEALPRRRAAI
jgi:hypothetical protein